MRDSPIEGFSLPEVEWCASLLQIFRNMILWYIHKIFRSIFENTNVLNLELELWFCLVPLRSG